MYKFDSKSFSLKMKTAIKNQGYTQEQFAELSGVPLATLRSYISDDKMPKAEPLKRIAEALNTSVDCLLDNEEETSTIVSKSITPKDIINAVNVLIEAYGENSIREITVEKPTIDLNNGYPNYEDVQCNAICIADDERIQSYLESIRTKGSIKNELSKVGEEDTYNKLLKKWANIDGCIFCGLIYDPSNEALCMDDCGNLYLEHFKSKSENESLPF